MNFGSSRRGFLKAGLAAGAGTAASLSMLGSIPAFGQSSPISDAERTKLGWKGLNLPPEAFDGPWKKIRAVIEKQVIDCHCHPYETRVQGGDSAAEQAQH